MYSVLVEEVRVSTVWLQRAVTIPPCELPPTCRSLLTQNATHVFPIISQDILHIFNKRTVEQLEMLSLSYSKCVIHFSRLKKN